MSPPGDRAPGRPVRSRAAGGTGVRERAAQATREGILNAAIAEFSSHGFAGARIERISTAARSYDRMIYYYFGSKEGLFVAAIEEIYRRFNDAQSKLEAGLDRTRPRQALRALIGFVWSYYRDNPEFMTLLNSENLHRGRHIARLIDAAQYASPAISVTEQVLRSGERLGVFAPGLRARDVYMMIASMCHFYLSNRYTLSAFLGEELQAPRAQADWQAFIEEAVLRVVAPAG